MSNKEEKQHTNNEISEKHYDGFHDHLNYLNISNSIQIFTANYNNSW